MKARTVIFGFCLGLMAVLLLAIPMCSQAATLSVTISDADLAAQLKALGVQFGAPTPPVPPTPPAPPTPPGPPQTLCAAFGSVLPIIGVTWGRQGSWHSSDSGSFGDNAVWVFKLAVPAGAPSSTSTGSFTTAEFNGPNTARQLTISTQACDFRARDYTGVNGPLVVCQDGTSCQVSYAVATPKATGGIAGLVAGQTYYVNVRNWSNFPPPPAFDCGQATCNAIMNFQPSTP